MQAARSNLRQIRAQGLSSGYKVMLGALFLSTLSPHMHPWPYVFTNWGLISLFLKYLKGNRNEKLKPLTGFVQAEGSLA